MNQHEWHLIQSAHPQVSDEFRYFRCAPLHGLFAPLHKVTSLSATVMPPRRSSLLQNAGLMSGHRTNSQESLSSIGSTSSLSRSGGRMRLGIMSLSGRVSIFHCVYAASCRS